MRFSDFAGNLQSTLGSITQCIPKASLAYLLFLQNKQGMDEQHRLQAEKMALIDTVKKLNREVAKLESFKKSLLQHLQEDDEVRAFVFCARLCCVCEGNCVFECACGCISFYLQVYVEVYVRTFWCAFMCVCAHMCAL